jgi:integrase
MIRDARTVDRLIEKDPFEALVWPRRSLGKPQPFTKEERDDILAYFREKNRFYYPFVFTMFFTGMRPSEALALTWGDVDLKRNEFSISKSWYLDEGNDTKTLGSERENKLMPEVAQVLQSIKPLHVTEESRVFLNQDGQPIKFHTWRAKIWYRALRAKGMKQRKPYAMRHTFISVGLANGVKIKWLAEYCGTSVAMIGKHYGNYLGGDSDEQFERLKGTKTGTLPGILKEATATDPDEVVENFGKEIGGPTWIRTRDQPVMSRWL